jgi:[acyl-carrier-protein] S-malonyltransferase
MVGVIFPGQGSQYVGMGLDLYAASPAAKDVFDQADKILGFSISQLCFKGPLEELKKTANCQPAILTVSIAVLEALRSSKSFNSLQIGFVAGLSLGEYSGLVASQSLRFQDVLRLVRLRAELMEEAANNNPGKMAAIIGLRNEEVKSVCANLDGAQIANLNCPGQVVISGKKEAVDKAKELLIQKGAKRAVDLEVSGAFHSSLMQSAAEKFKRVLEEVKFSDPRIPLVSNVDARGHSQSREIRENLEKQICNSVLWEDSMRFIISQKVNQFYELGPGKVLKGLMRKIDNNIDVINIEKKEDIERTGG